MQVFRSLRDKLDSSSDGRGRTRDRRGRAEAPVVGCRDQRGTGDLTELDLAEDLAARSRAHLVATTAAEPGGPQPRPGKLSASSGKALDHWQNSHPEAGQPGHKSRMQAGFGSTPQVAGWDDSASEASLQRSRQPLRQLVVTGQPDWQLSEPGSAQSAEAVSAAPFHAWTDLFDECASEASAPSFAASESSSTVAHVSPGARATLRRPAGLKRPLLEPAAGIISPQILFRHQPLRKDPPQDKHTLHPKPQMPTSAPLPIRKPGTHLSSSGAEGQKGLAGFQEASYETGDEDGRISAEVVGGAPQPVPPIPPAVPLGFGRPLSSGPQLPASCSAQSIASYRSQLSEARGSGTSAGLMTGCCTAPPVGHAPDLAEVSATPSATLRPLPTRPSQPDPEASAAVQPQSDFPQLPESHPPTHLQRGASLHSIAEPSADHPSHTAEASAHSRARLGDHDPAGAAPPLQSNSPFTPPQAPPATPGSRAPPADAPAANSHGSHPMLSASLPESLSPISPAPTPPQDPLARAADIGPGMQRHPSGCLCCARASDSIQPQLSATLQPGSQPQPDLQGFQYQADQAASSPSPTPRQQESLRRTSFWELSPVKSLNRIPESHPGHGQQQQQLSRQAAEAPAVQGTAQAVQRSPAASPETPLQVAEVQKPSRHMPRHALSLPRFVPAPAPSPNPAPWAPDVPAAFSAPDEAPSTQQVNRPAEAPVRAGTPALASQQSMEACLEAAQQLPPRVSAFACQQAQRSQGELTGSSSSPNHAQHAQNAPEAPAPGADLPGQGQPTQDQAGSAGQLTGQLRGQALEPPAAQPSQGEAWVSVAARIRRLESAGSLGQAQGSPQPRASARSLSCEPPAAPQDAGSPHPVPAPQLPPTPYLKLPYPSQHPMSQDPTPPDQPHPEAALEGLPVKADSAPDPQARPGTSGDQAHQPAGSQHIAQLHQEPTARSLEERCQHCHAPTQARGGSVGPADVPAWTRLDSGRLPSEKRDPRSLQGIDSAQRSASQHVPASRQLLFPGSPAGSAQGSSTSEASFAPSRQQMLFTPPQHADQAVHAQRRSGSLPIPVSPPMALRAAVRNPSRSPPPPRAPTRDPLRESPFHLATRKPPRGSRDPQRDLQEAPSGQSLTHQRSSSSLPGARRQGSGGSPGMARAGSSQQPGLSSDPVRSCRVWRADGAPYTGQGQGLGVCRFRNGNRFEGSFLDGSLSGLGVYTFASQGCYAGQWRHGKFGGVGMERFADGALYVGEYEAGVAQGLGICLFLNGDTYEGHFGGGRPHGRGMHKATDGSIYVGTYEAGHRSGSGAYDFPNGDRYVGAWRFDLPCGLGCYSCLGGGLHEGEWVEGLKDGWGMATSASGRVTCGRWSSGSSTWSQAFPDSRHSWEGSTPRGAERCALAADAAEQARRAAAHGMDLVYAHPEEVRAPAKRAVKEAREAAVAAEEVQALAAALAAKAAALKAASHGSHGSHGQPLQRQPSRTAEIRGLADSFAAQARLWNHSAPPQEASGAAAEGETRPHGRPARSASVHSTSSLSMT